MAIINIRNLSFKYHNKKMFENFKLEIQKNKIISIIGPNSCGKTTLVKILVGLLPYNGAVDICTLPLIKKNIKDIRKKIGIVFSENQFVAETVMDEIAFTLENMNYKKQDIGNKIEEISKYLGIYDILEHNPHDLNCNQKQLVSIASALTHEPEILILDDALVMLDPKEKEKILDILKELKKKGITIVNITHDIEDTLISDEIIVMNEGKIVLKGSRDLIYQEEKTLINLGFKLPFMVELSNRLIFYNLIDHVIYDMKEMVHEVWK